VITFFVLTDRPEQAKFLTAEERKLARHHDAAERRATEGDTAILRCGRRYYNPKVLLWLWNYLGIVTASLGMLIFIPQMIKSLGDYSNMTIGWLTMIPYTVAYRNGGVGAHFRSHERATLESVHRLHILNCGNWSSPA